MIYVLHAVWSSNRRSLKELDNAIGAATQAGRDAEDAERRFLERKRKGRAD